MFKSQEDWEGGAKRVARRGRPDPRSQAGHSASDRGRRSSKQRAKWASPYSMT